MRVVYDYGIRNTGSRATSGQTGAQNDRRTTNGVGPVQRRESVIVISLGAEKAEALPDRRESPDYEVVLSPEAQLRDAEVRQHERAHARTLGPYATTPVMYDTATGPDGEVVATGGKIGVDLAPVPGDPEATLSKARVIINAAYAPGSPSGGDMRVVAEAYRLAHQAQRELSDQPTGTITREA